ncbi:MAG TPA: CehA/McbA family metallohydrolase [Solirubrobacterales bacterium]|nr:CehA/McbA family metallohydrolase [Solirubrobacterales bacterium]
MTDLYDLSCVVHVHSTYSDGTASVPEILDAARDCGREAVLLTDHDSLGAKQDGWEGWHDGVLLLVGTEISPKAGHYLAFGLDEKIDHRGLSEWEIVRAVRDAGAIGIAAHPFSRSTRIMGIVPRPHPWRSLEEVDGIELWSVLTDAADSWGGPRQLYRFLRDPLANLDGPPAANLAAWDELCQRRRVTAIGSVDAHQSGVRLPAIGAISPMPNRRYFGLLGTHVLCRREPTRELDRDRAEVHDALRAGRCYVALDALGDPRGFAFWAERDDEALAMGDEAGGRGWTLRVRLPRAASVRILRDGEPIARRDASAVEQEAPGAGAYRVEAWLDRGGRERVWILSNPIYLRGAGRSKALE